MRGRGRGRGRVGCNVTGGEADHAGVDCGRVDEARVGHVQKVPKLAEHDRHCGAAHRGAHSLQRRCGLGLGPG